MQRPWARRRNIFDPPTLLDSLLLSPLRAFVQFIYHFLIRLRGSPFNPPRNKPAIRIVCISDTHTYTPRLPAGDVLIHAGDLTNAGTTEDIQKQLDWLESLPHEYKIFIAGNHDSYFDHKSRKEVDVKGDAKLNYHNLHYLQDSALELNFKGGRTLQFYGAPAIPRCGGDDFAFQYERESPPWAGTIPLSTDVLITHTPPKYHLDIDLGCIGLLQEIWRVRPRLHIFGHVHSGHGRQAVYWDAGQAAYERLMARRTAGVVSDLIPNTAWLDAVRVVVYGIQGVLWQYLMVGSKGAHGSLLINAALTWQSTSSLGNPPEIVDL